MTYRPVSYPPSHDSQAIYRVTVGRETNTQRHRYDASASELMKTCVGAMVSGNHSLATSPKIARCACPSSRANTLRRQYKNVFPSHLAKIKILGFANGSHSVNSTLLVAVSGKYSVYQLWPPKVTVKAAALERQELVQGLLIKCAI